MMAEGDIFMEFELADSDGEQSLKGEDTRSKRKGSPLSSNEPAKKPVSCGDGVTLRRRNSLPNISKLSDIEKKKSKGKTMAFSDMMRITFDDQSFKDSITPALYDMISPLIQETVQATVATAVSSAVNSMRTSVIDEMLKSNRELQESVKQQSDIINEQKAVIEDQKATIQDKNDLIDDLQCQVHCLSGEVDDLKQEVNELEQYGRRNSLRINNLKLNGPTGPPRDEQQLTSAVVYFLNTAVLKGDHKLTDQDVERCHYVGKPKQEGSTQILVKFFRYHDKRRVFALKRNLKNNASKTFLTEDLTAINHTVVKTLLPMKKDGKIDSFWTRDGRILVKKDKDSAPVRVSPNANIERSLGL